MQVGASVLTEIVHGVMTVSLNKPDVVNAIDSSMRHDLREVFKMIRNQDEVRAVILTGDAKNFSVGSDIASLEDLNERSAIKIMHEIRDAALAIASCNKPVIAALEGHVAGAGIGLALLCDKVIASKKARFSFSFSRIGLGPDWGLSVTLPERVGRMHARRLIWEATRLDARSAQQLGLVDQICLPGGAADAAWVDARILANKAPLAIQSTKCHFRFPLFELGAALESEASNQTECLTSADFSEGLSAYRHRRRPDFG